MSSKAVTRSPTAARRRPSSSTAAAGEATASQAVTTARGRAKSLRVAAVTMPRVPSAPMKSCLRS
jgi:hypothetical protein